MRAGEYSGLDAMRSLLFIGSYCALSGVVAFFVRRYIRGVVLGTLLSPTISALILQIVAYLHLGYVDAWAEIAFVTSWLIALACTLVIRILARLWSTLRKRNNIGSA